MKGKTHLLLKTSLTAVGLLCTFTAPLVAESGPHAIEKVHLKDPKCDPKTSDEEGCTTIEFNLAYPKDKTIESAIKLLVIEEVQQAIEQLAPEKKADLLNSESLNDLAKRTRDIFDDLFERKEIMRRAKLTVDVKVRDARKRYVNAELGTYWDVGAAHPAHTSRIKIFDHEQDGKPTTLKEILSPQELEAFLNILDKKLAQQLKESYLRPEQDQMLKLLAEHTEVLEDGYRVVFSPYDVAAYVYGHVEIEIKNTELNAKH
ncbi:MAG: RsiV family protein [Holosporales bacterium]